MAVGQIQGKYGQYPVEVINGAVYYRDSSGRTVSTGFTPSSVTNGRFSGPDGSSHSLQSMLQDIQSRYNRGQYT